MPEYTREELAAQKEGAPVGFPNVPSMGDVDVAAAASQADMLAATEGQSVAYGAGAEALPDMQPSEGAPVADEGAGDQVPAAAPFAAAAGGESYLRVRVRVEGDQATVLDASRVDGPLAAAREARGGFAYQVTVDGRPVAGDAVPDLGVLRSFPNPQSPDPRERVHHISKVDSYEFTARIPAERLPADALERVEISLLRITDASRALPLAAERSLLEEHAVEVREVGRLRGSELAARLRRLVSG